MCGIAGFFNPDPQISRSEARVIAESMGQAIYHRGPDSGGIWINDNNTVAFSFRRLAIVDLSEDGDQPMISASGRYVIVYNGEIYNAPTLKADLNAQGYPFKGRSDTEVILAAAELWGVNIALQKINGMYGFALWDREEKALHLVCDRMGKKPLYIARANGSLLFASELKSLVKHPDFEKRIDRNALALYMRYRCVPAPHCIFQNVWRLSGGHRFTVRLDDAAHLENKPLSAAFETYWQAPDVMNSHYGLLQDISDSDAINGFEDVLKTCVSDRLLSDVPLGAFLSGGIDSSSIVAMMQSLSSSPVKTYSIGFKEAGFDEAVYAREVAAHLGTDHHEHYVNARDAMDVIPLLPDIYDEPFSDVSAVPTYLVSKFARRDVTVALSGDGGDEMMGGYNRHVQGPYLWDKMRHIPRRMRRMMGSGAQAVPVSMWDQILKNTPQIGTKIHKAADIFALSEPRDIYDSLINVWDQDIVKDLALPDLLIDDPTWRLRPSLHLSEKMMMWDMMFYMQNDILTKVDRASMAVSLEARSPLLDPRVFEYVWRLPLHMKIRNGKGKWLLRQVLSKYVPDHLFERPKQGFAMPVGAWLKTDLKDWADTLLSPSAIQDSGFFDDKIIQKTWQAHLKGHGNHADRLWTVLMFQAWHKKWM